MLTNFWIPTFFSKYRSLILLSSIFILAFFLRVYHLGELPNGLHEDEMMNGYVGRYILLNGKDLYGNRWPLLYFNNFGDYPPIIPMYLSGIFTFLLGLTPLAIRFPIALVGSLAIFPTYFLSRKIFQKDRYALASAFFLAILPWHIVLSRATAENITATSVFLTSTYFLLQYWKKRNPIHLGGLTVLTALLYFLYASFRVTTPLFFFASLFLANDKKWRTVMVSLMLVFTLCTLAISRTEWGKGRFQQTSIFYFNNTVNNRIQNMESEEGRGHVIIARIFHNKVIVVGREFIKQYLSYFSPGFLFADTALPYRYIQEDHGVLYLSFLGVVVIACLTSIFSKNASVQSIFTADGSKIFAFLLVLLATSPIPPSLTLDDVPNIHRAAMIGVLLIFPLTFAFAVTQVVRWKKYSIQTLVLLFLLGELVYFWHQYSIHTIYVQSRYRGDDRTALAQYLISHHQDFDTVYLPHDVKPLYYLFFSQNFSPSLAGNFSSNIRIDHIENMYFTVSNCSSDTEGIVVTPKTLIINRDNCKTPYGLIETGQIKFADGTESFRLLQPLVVPAPAVSVRDKNKKNN